MRKILETVSGWFVSFWKKGDLILLALCIAASLFGLVEIASATNHYGAYQSFLFKQILALVLGIGMYILVTLIDIEIIAEQKALLVLFNVFFIGLLLFFFEKNNTTGNKSWLHFSFLPFNIQPAELCKVTFILIIAKTMSVYKNKISSLACVARITLHTIFIVGLILVISGDAGVALQYVFIFIAMAFLGGVRGWWFAGGFAGIAAITPIVWKFFMQDYQKNRILMIFDPTIDPQGLDVRYQTMLSTKALSAGGLAGQGLFNGGTIQAGNLPAQHTDFIFSSVGNELGMIGCIGVLLFEAAIIARCIYVGLKTRNFMNRMICFGVASMLLFQVISNVGMCLGLLPVIGLTLPFFSYGGSSLVTMFVAVGLVSGIKYRPAEDTSVRYISPY